MDPSSVSVIGAVGDASVGKSPANPPEKKTKKEKQPVKPKKEKPTSSSVDRIAQLDQKWSERFNRLEVLLLSKSLQPTFSSEVRVTPSPPTTVARDTEPFFQPTSRVLEDSPSHQRTGRDFSAAQHGRQATSTGLCFRKFFCTAHWPRLLCCSAAGKLPSEDSASGSSTV